MKTKSFISKSVFVMALGSFGMLAGCQGMNPMASDSIPSNPGYAYGGYSYSYTSVTDDQTAYQPRRNNTYRSNSGSSSGTSSSSSSSVPKIDSTANKETETTQVPLEAPTVGE